MSYFKDRELEFQIRLAELQADLQIRVTQCFGITALLLGGALTTEQIGFSIRETALLGIAYFLFLASIVLAIGAIVFFLRSYPRVLETRKQIGELRKEFLPFRLNEKKEGKG